MERTLYLECYSGISGDMVTAALLDLGASEDFLREELSALAVGGYEIKIGRVKRCGVEVCDFEVLLKEDGTGEKMRSFQEIQKLLEESSLSPEVKSLSEKIFLTAAQSEAQACGCPLEELSLHELGIVEAIVYVVGAAACAVNLSIKDTYVSTLYEGQGITGSGQERVPVPIPKVAMICQTEGLPIQITDREGELLTVTGVAIAAALRTREGKPGEFAIWRMGLGTGVRGNLLRAFLLKGEAETEDEIWSLETNIDDTNGENLGFVMELLFQAGARDVSFTPIFMKKNRPAYKLEVLCKEEERPVLEELIFQNTTSIGLRRKKETRRILPRRLIQIESPYGRAQVKVVRTGERVKVYPEYDSVHRICLETGRPYQEIYQELVVEAWKRKDEF